MGYSLSWIAVKGTSPEETRSLLGARPTDAWEEFPESRITAAELPAGWYLLVFQRKELGHELLKKLSSRGELVYCYVEEYVMVSSCAGWRQAEMIWSIVDDGQQGIRSLQVTGHPPRGFP